MLSVRNFVDAHLYKDEETVIQDALRNLLRARPDLRVGLAILAHVYPQAIRATRDLLRRRNYFVLRRAEIQGHIKLTNYQYNLPSIQTKLARHANRDDIADRFSDSSVRKNVEADIHLMDCMEEEIKGLENDIIRHAKGYDPRTYYRLQTVPGIGAILALVILYEVEDIARFPSVQQFCSYTRLVKCPKESAGKRYGFSGSRIGNAHHQFTHDQALDMNLVGNQTGPG